MRNACEFCDSSLVGKRAIRIPCAHCYCLGCFYYLCRVEYPCYHQCGERIALPLQLGGGEEIVFTYARTSSQDDEKAVEGHIEATGHRVVRLQKQYQDAARGMREEGAKVLQVIEEALQQVVRTEERAVPDYLASLASAQARFRELTSKSHQLRGQYRTAQAELNESLAKLARHVYRNWTRPSRSAVTAGER